MNVIRLFILCFTLVLAGCASQNHSAKHDSGPIIAADTSRTIDLTNPPRDIWDRIRRGYAIPNLNTELVTHWTNYYASHPKSVLRMSERASRYLYHIVSELEERGLPTELALLPFVESAYNPEAYSKAHASGLWQFIPSTGKYYDLQQDSWQDQRRDPIASTDAALRYLNYLYEFQGDWYLALASYNWGEGAVRRAIERNAAKGLGGDYLSLKMPRETQNYVPKLQAIKNIITNPERYGITLPEVHNEPYFVTVQRNDDIEVEVAARLAEMSIEEFKFLNPSYQRAVIPADRAQLLLPKDRVDIFNANIAAYTGNLSNWRVYQPERGESISAIAQRHGISIAELRSLNGLTAKQTLASAQGLLVPIDMNATQTAANDPIGIQLASLDTNAAVNASKNASRSQSDVTVMRRQPNVLTHTVKRGDTLFGLARQYNTTVSELQKLNNLKSNTLKLGYRLRVPGTQIRG